VSVEVSADGYVTVSDHGPGVHREDREHLFDRFRRGKRARREGAGLGLAIVKEIMELHGGAVELSDNPGNGARFTLRFRR
jgi:signal transduction histidine kinase